ncbi:hypothetical protein GCM10025785_22240 [Corynebacterium canis]
MHVRGCVAGLRRVAVTGPVKPAENLPVTCLFRVNGTPKWAYIYRVGTLDIRTAKQWWSDS